MIKVESKKGQCHVDLDGEYKDILTEACLTLSSVAKLTSKTFGVPFKVALQRTIEFCYKNGLEYCNPEQTEDKGDETYDFD